MGITIQEFLRTQFVDGETTITPVSVPKATYYCFVFQAMREANREDNPGNFQDIPGSYHWEHFLSEAIPGNYSGFYDAEKLISEDVFGAPEGGKFNEFINATNLRRQYEPNSDVADFLKWLRESVENEQGINTKDTLYQVIDSLLEEITEENEKRIEERKKTGKLEREIIQLIQAGGCRQIIFTGAPGTGKTHIAKRIAELGKELEWRTDSEGKNMRYEFVQLHPSYDYTDFVEGLRPVETGKKGVAFRRVDGVFKEFCRHVAEEKDSDHLYFFIIDEINRANLSKVFGELMYCLERDKRGPEHPVQTQYRNLPTYVFSKEEKKYVLVEKIFKRDIFENGFYIPENVVIIGTMNDIDRSVDTMDFALRRRFEWKEFRVDVPSLQEAFEDPSFGPTIVNNAKALAEAVDTLNRKIKEKGGKYGLNEHYYISQGQFANLPNKEENIQTIMQYVWDYRIKSLLEEYLRGETSTDIADFVKEASEAFVVTCKEEQQSQGTVPNETGES